MYGNSSGGLTLTSYSGVMPNSNSGASVVLRDQKDGSPTFVGFFVCGMIGRFGYEKVSIVTTIHWIGFTGM